jgi:hypothetical protein
MSEAWNHAELRGSSENTGCFSQNPSKREICESTKNPLWGKFRGLGSPETQASSRRFILTEGLFPYGGQHFRRVMFSLPAPNELFSSVPFCGR